MGELSAALRQFADRVERGEVLPGATQCVVALSDDMGTVNATYIGRLVPAAKAGIHIAARAVQNFNEESLKAAVPFSATRGSTH